MTPVYSTREIHPRDRLSFWLEVATKAYFRHDFDSSKGSAFLGSIQWGRLANVEVSVFECDPCEATRSTRDAASGDCEDYLLSLQFCGQGMHEQDGRLAVARDGGFILTDARRPLKATFTRPTHTLTLKIPRHALVARLGNVTPLLARTFDPDNPIVRLTSDFLAMLPSRLAALGGPAATKIADQALDLIALACGTQTFDGTALSSARAGALTRLKAAIDMRLSDPELKPASAAAAAGISVRYANALLAEEGTSLERYILSRRLARCRRALEDPASAHRTVGEIAYSWGFADLSHFGRRFKAEFGCAPSEYRRHARLSASAGVPVAAE